jgi:glycosyltransferase involved in cell wall biosynthesis
MISIVIPYYAHEREILNTLASISLQENVTYEVIIVDDGSPIPLDETLVQSYIKDAIVLRHVQNKGAPAARNTGLDAASGSYVIFWDADITADPTMLLKMQKVLDTQPHIDMVYSNFVFGPKTFYLRPFSYEALKVRNYIHSTSLLRKHVALHWDESLKKLQDWDYWLTFSEAGSMGYWIDEVLFSVGERKEGMSRWIPSIAYCAPFRWLPYIRTQVQKYKEAERIVKAKHALP